MSKLNIDRISRIALLFIKKRAGTISIVEDNELSVWVNSNNENADLYQKLTDDGRLADDLLDMEKIDLEYRTQKIIKRISVQKKINTARVYKLMAAACIIGLVLTSIYLLYNSKHDSVNKIPTASSNIIPGKNGAVLTLDNGQIIVLDSIKEDGIIAVQGNVQIIKKGDQVLYLDKTTGEPAIAYNTISTPQGQAFHFSLEDGTTVWLNAGSSISFPTAFANNERRVKLTGEAYFDVAKSKDGNKTPFIINGVQNKDWAITVLGTQFNVNAYNPNNNIQTSLVEGSVKITNTTVPSNSTILKPGQQANMDSDGKVSVHNFDMEEVLAWKNGKFVFHNASLNDILPVIARWYNVEVIYENKVTENYTINVSRNMPLKELLSFIEKSGGVHFEIKDNLLIVKK